MEFALRKDPTSEILKYNQIENITSNSHRKARAALSYDKFGHNHVPYTKQSTLTAEI